MSLPLFIDKYPHFKGSLEKFIHTLTPNSHQDHLTITTLNAGMSSTQLFLLAVENHQFVIRTLKPKYPLSKRKAEVQAQQHGAKINIAPEVLFVDANFTFMVMPYLQGKTLQQNAHKSTETLNTLGFMIAQLHRYKGSFPHRSTQTDRTIKHIQKIKDQSIALPSCYAQLYNEYNEQTRQITGEEQVLCHNDLNPTNIIVDDQGKIMLIDWTTTSWDNRYEELGFFTFTSGLNQNQTVAFLASYFGRTPTVQEWNKLRIGKKRAHFLSATVWFSLSESKEEKKISLEQRVKELDKLLESPTLKTGEEIIARNEVTPPLSGKNEAIKRCALSFLKSCIMTSG